MNNAGITTQYGFLFQRKAFILFALENAGTKQTFTFEGRDDIEISADESIYSVKSADASYIQVKSGTISESCFCKVICNWLLFDKESSGTVTLFAENQLDTLVSNITKDIIFDYIIQGKEKKRSSIAWKTYNKFQNLIETDREAFLGIIEKFLQIINIHICSMDELDSRLEKVFFENYCRDITEYQLAKSKRLERFISYMNQEIDNALKAQRPCTLLFADLMKMIMTVCDEISDHRYIAKIPELKKRAKSEATQLVKIACRICLYRPATFFALPSSGRVGQLPATPRWAFRLFDFFYDTFSPLPCNQRLCSVLCFGASYRNLVEDVAIVVSVNSVDLVHFFPSLCLSVYCCDCGVLALHDCDIALGGQLTGHLQALNRHLSTLDDVLNLLLSGHYLVLRFRSWCGLFHCHHYTTIALFCQWFFRKIFGKIR